jgi:hypothetical protein
METGYKKIGKERVGKLRFPDDDVLDTEKQRAARLLELEKAMVLGNLDRIKVKIYFEDTTDRYAVETTIWGVTDACVILKQGVTIPIKRVLKIN